MFSAVHCSVGSACSIVRMVLDEWLVISVLSTVWSSLQIADFEFAEMAEEPWNKVSVAREVRHSPPEALSDGVLTKVGSSLKQDVKGLATTIESGLDVTHASPSWIWAHGGELMEMPGPGLMLLQFATLQCSWAGAAWALSCQIHIPFANGEARSNRITCDSRCCDLNPLQP